MKMYSVCVCMRVRVHVCMHVCVHHVCMHVCVHHVCMRVRVHVCMRVRVHVCMHVCVTNHLGFLYFEGTGTGKTVSPMI